ncbi:MAG: hypothetical protein C5B60_09950 [Chloroflexi bacterium]|nr:MAG: hypothetical protein C5B60_09950 [Chloroflexota bacterium]
MPRHSATAGSIILPEAYALGKMMDSSGWNGLLRDGITPGDIDLCFDNQGFVLHCDFSSSYSRWEDALTGQRRNYQAAIRHAPHAAVLCKHSVTPEMHRKIDTVRDVDTFHVMVWDHGPIICPTVFKREYWQEFVVRWVNYPQGPHYLRRRVLSLWAFANRNMFDIAK